MADPSPQQVADIIGLKYSGRNSFLELCAKGCDPEELANYLVYITSKSEITITPKNKKRKPYKPSMRPLDTINEALEGIEKRELIALQKAILKQAKNIEKVNQTRVVHKMHMDQEDFDTNIFVLPNLLTYYANEFIPLVLSASAKTGSRQRPYFNRYMNDMIDYIEDKTGDLSYRLISEMLNEYDPENEYDEGSIKQWRYRHSPSE